MSTSSSAAPAVDAVPRSFICPISHEVMRNPVTAPNGTSYEREAIETWIDTNPVCPLTKDILRKADLRPNLALKGTIEEYLAQLSLASDGQPAIPTSASTAATTTTSTAAATTTSSSQSAPQRPSMTVAATYKVRSAPPSPASPSTSPAKKGAAGRKKATPEAEETPADEMEILVSIIPASEGARTPAHICCVVDVSGSMGSEAEVENEQGVKETHGLSVLDVVKHAVKTIIFTLNANDLFSLVSFSGTAATVIDALPMNDAGRTRALDKLNSLDADGNTNLWAGLERGLELMGKHADFRGTSSVLLLTDGQPTVRPPRGELQMLQRFKERNKGAFPCTIGTFGFGYSLDSALLNSIAEEGSGTYAFIPDAGFVGTTFVHAASNILATAAQQANLTLTLDLKRLWSELSPASTVVPGGYKATVHPKGSTIDIPVGSLQYGQPRRLIVRVPVPKGALNEGPQPTIRAELTFSDLQTHKEELVREEGMIAREPEDSTRVEAESLRLEALDIIRKYLALGSAENAAAKKAIAAYRSRLQDSPAFADSALLQALFQDISGQVTEAFSRVDWFTRWGVHYLPSLVRAHFLQQCNNFKDPGVQLYGGSLFTAIREVADDIFCKLPPPEPTLHRYDQSSYSGGGGGGGRAAPLSMTSFYNSHTTCFSGDSIVTLADGSQKPVSEIRKGDLLAAPPSANSTSPSPSPSRVVCVMKTLCRNGVANLVSFPGGLRLTSWHPVRLDGVWTFPSSVHAPTPQACDAVYSFVLDSNHIMIINGVECVTLAHGFQEDVVRHEYFGTQAILDDLRACPGFCDGLVVLKPDCLRVNKDTDRVCGLKIEAAIDTVAVRV